jgi:hypothetical protein
LNVDDVCVRFWWVKSFPIFTKMKIEKFILMNSKEIWCAWKEFSSYFLFFIENVGVYPFQINDWYRRSLMWLRAFNNFLNQLQQAVRLFHVTNLTIKYDFLWLTDWN